MKVVIKIDIGEYEFASKEQFRQLAIMVGQPDVQRVLRIELPREDPRLAQALELLKTFGKKASGFRCVEKDKDEFWIMPHTIYDDSEIESARYLWMLPERTVESAGTSPVPFVHSEEATFQAGLLNRLKSFTSGKPVLALVRHPNKIVASDEFRKMAEEGGFRHLVFKPALFEGRETEGLPAIWRMTSDLVLPRMSERCIFVNNNTGEPFAGDFSKGGMRLIHEDPFAPTGFRYREAALKEVEPFDVAVTWESLAAHPSAYRIMVLSQRFRQFCLKAKTSANWYPIHIDQ